MSFYKRLLLFRLTLHVVLQTAPSQSARSPPMHFQLSCINTISLNTIHFTAHMPIIQRRPNTQQHKRRGEPLQMHAFQLNIRSLNNSDRV